MGRGEGAGRGSWGNKKMSENECFHSYGQDCNIHYYRYSSIDRWKKIYFL